MSNRYHFLFNIFAFCYILISIYGILLLFYNACENDPGSRESAIVFIVLAFLYFLRKLILKIRLHYKL